MIRLAHPLDIPRLINLAELYHEEVVQVGQFYPGLDVELASVNMMNTMRSETGFAIVAVEGTTVVGFMWACVVLPVPWSTYSAADCLMFYVHPDHRGGLHGYGMLKAFKTWACEVECDEVRISTASGIQTDRTEAIFHKLGFRPLGTVFTIRK